MALPKNERILVTGGAGFIGSALIWSLNEKGVDNIIICDRLGSDDKWKNLAPLRCMDYIDADDLLDGLTRRADYLSDVSTVYHLGACTAETEPDAGFLMRNNFEYTKRLAKWSLRKRARFVYASSGATYGDGSRGVSDSDTRLSQLRPLTACSYSKHLFDCYAARRGILNSMVGLNFFDIFGPNESHKGEDQSLVGRVSKEIYKTGKARVSNAEQTRDFLYIKDAVEMAIFLANRPLASGLFNICSGTSSSRLQVTEAVFRALGRQPCVEMIDGTPDVRFRHNVRAETTRLMNAGFPESATPLGEAIHDYVLNYLVPGKRLGE